MLDAHHRSQSSSSLQELRRFLYRGKQEVRWYASVSLQVFVISKGHSLYVRTVVRVYKLLIEGSYQSFQIISFLTKARHFPTAKHSRIGLKRTTAVNCCGSVRSLQNVNQDKLSVGVDRGRPSLSCCLHVWWIVSITCHFMVKDNLTVSASVDNIHCK